MVIFPTWMKGSPPKMIQNVDLMSSRLMQKKNRWHLNLTFPVGKCCLFSCPQNHNFWGEQILNMYGLWVLTSYWQALLPKSEDHCEVRLPSNAFGICIASPHSPKGSKRIQKVCSKIVGDMRLVTPAGILTCQTIFHDLFWRFRLNFLTRRWCCCSGAWFTHAWKRGLAVMWWATKWAGQNGAQLHLNAFLRKIMGRFMWMVCLVFCRQEAGKRQGGSYFADRDWGHGQRFLPRARILGLCCGVFEFGHGFMPKMRGESAESMSDSTCFNLHFQDVPTFGWMVAIQAVIPQTAWPHWGVLTVGVRARCSFKAV